MKIQNKNLVYHWKQRNNIPIPIFFFVAFVTHLVESNIQCLIYDISSQSAHIFKSQLQDCYLKEIL